MTSRLRALLLLCSLLGLVACGASNEDELRQWMTEQRANTKPHVTPIAEPKKFQPQDYTAGNEIDPFSPVRLTQALKKDSARIASNAALIAPEMARRKEPLEAYPLDAMTMVGSMNKNGKPVALLKVDNLLYQVQIGNYLGPNYGKVIGITETAIQIREIVQDATGDWTERIVSLELQEGKK
jgi:type IV pilus assembly protein PilP